MPEVRVRLSKKLDTKIKKLNAKRVLEDKPSLSKEGMILMLAELAADKLAE